MKPNTQFKLTVEDIDTIEKALRDYMRNVKDSDQREIQKVLGKLHNQKNWYRPKTNTYVGG